VAVVTVVGDTVVVGATVVVVGVVRSTVKFSVQVTPEVVPVKLNTQLPATPEVGVNVVVQSPDESAVLGPFAAAPPFCALKMSNPSLPTNPVAVRVIELPTVPGLGVAVATHGVGAGAATAPPYPSVEATPTTPNTVTSRTRLSWERRIAKF
jgi:hypothetical protein